MTQIFGCARAFPLLPCGLNSGRYSAWMIRSAGITRQIEVSLPREATAPGRTSRESSTAKLAKFFPDSTPLRIAVSLTRVAGKGGLLSESTVIEFGTPHEVLFASTLPLEFADKLRLRNSDGTLDVEACVVALQYNGSRTAVAARFTQEVANWIVKP